MVPKGWFQKGGFWQMFPGTQNRNEGLRGPAAILFISRDTCSDSIAKLFRACFRGGIAQLSRDMLQSGYRRDVPV